MSEASDHLIKIEAYCRFKAENLRFGGPSSDSGLKLATATLIVPMLTPLMAAVAHSQGLISDPKTMAALFIGPMAVGYLGLAIQGALKVVARDKFTASAEAEYAERKTPGDITRDDKVNTELDKLFKNSQKDVFSSGDSSGPDYSRFKPIEIESGMSR